MVRWRFERAGFFLNLDNLLNALTVDPTPVFGHLNVLELSFDKAFIDPEILIPDNSIDCNSLVGSAFWD
jgi:hypothetical protein